MDFGFSPGGGHLANIRAMIARRASTTLVARPGMTTIHQLVDYIDTNAGITTPIGDLLIGTHANEEGQLFIPAFPGQVGATLYETLETTLSDTSKSMALDDAAIGYKARDPITHFVHIKGCNVGKAEPFLLKLQEAFGKHVHVTAPKFFHGLTSVPSQGIFEYMAYEFAISRREQFTSRDAALAVFDEAQFKLIDGETVVPTADWNRLVPPNPNHERKQQVAIKLGVRLGNRTTITAPRQYRVMPLRIIWGIDFPSVGDIPSDAATQREALRKSLRSDDRFKDSHPYPEWKREGFKDFDDLFANYKWVFQRRGATLVATGTRYLYVAMVVITDPATTPSGGFFGDGTAVFNFYPNTGSSLAAITTGLQESDVKYFATV